MSHQSPYHQANRHGFTGPWGRVPGGADYDGDFKPTRSSGWIIGGRAS